MVSSPRLRPTLELRPGKGPDEVRANDGVRIQGHILPETMHPISREPSESIDASIPRMARHLAVAGGMATGTRPLQQCRPASRLGLMPTASNSHSRARAPEG